MSKTRPSVKFSGRINSFLLSVNHVGEVFGIFATLGNGGIGEALNFLFLDELTVQFLLIMRLTVDWEIFGCPAISFWTIGLSASANCLILLMAVGLTAFADFGFFEFVLVADVFPS